MKLVLVVVIMMLLTFFVAPDIPIGTIAQILKVMFYVMTIGSVVAITLIGSLIIWGIKIGAIDRTDFGFKREQGKVILYKNKITGEWE